MFATRKAVIEMPADPAASAGGGAMGYAGFWARVAALLVDSAIVTIVGIVLIVALGIAMGATGVVIGNVIYLLLNLLYWPVMESSARQATIGKSLLGIQVTDLGGNRTSFIKALLRNLAKIISSIPLGIGFLLAAFTGRKQALHDMITGCLVVRAGPSSFLKAVVAAVGGLAIASGGAYYYVTEVYLPQLMETTMKGAGKDVAREMEKAMKKAQKGGPDVKTAPQVAQAPAPASPPPPPASTKPAPKPEAVPASKPGAKVAAATPSAPPAMKLAAPKRAPEAAPAAVGEKPKAKRRAAPRKPAVPMMAAEAPPAPLAKTPKYNDVMTAVMYRDYLGAAELLDLGWWADRVDSNGVTPLMAAAMNGDALIAQLLLKHGADPNRSGPGGSVLGYAGRSGDAKLVELLKKAGAR